MSTRGRLAMLATAAAVLCATILIPARPALAAIVPPNITVHGWRVQFRLDRPHRFGSCVSVPVNHFHVEVFQAIGGGRFKYLSNFHIGSYHNGGSRCFVVWNNYRPDLCAKTCGSGQSGLTNVIRTALFAVAVAIGVGLSATVATLLAVAISGPVYFALP